MADTKERQELKEQFMAKYKEKVDAAGGDVVKLSLGDEALELMLDFMTDPPKEATRTKTFRFPVALLAWFEGDAKSLHRTPNAHLVALIEAERATKQGL